jgi:hypothetical protein
VCPSCRAFFRRSVQSGYNNTYFCIKASGGSFFSSCFVERKQYHAIFASGILVFYFVQNCPCRCFFPLTKQPLSFPPLLNKFLLVSVPAGIFLFCFVFVKIFNYKNRFRVMLNSAESILVIGNPHFFNFFYLGNFTYD